MSTNKIPLSLEANLDVVSKYNELLTQTVGENSLYIKTKETLDEYFKDNNMTAVDKANLVSSTLSNITIQCTQAILNAALEWAVQEKTMTLKIAETEYGLGKINQETQNAVTANKAAEVEYDLLQAKMIRDYGVPTKVNGIITSLSDSGEAYHKIELLKQQTANELTKNGQLTAQTKELYARIHQLVADAYINHGVFNGYTISESGLSNITRTNTGFKTLSEMNVEVGKQQANGYVYNAWANAASSSASMLATLISSESAIDYQPYVTSWKNTVDKLNSLGIPNASTGV